ncbi:MAG: RagB/SusD family nutrient uptake outer membrane protein [Bacteroidales bacterium]|nr:RagB/SusD family nutrient uptake outer membrane protein [Bacteroidales bacterium]
MNLSYKILIKFLAATFLIAAFYSCEEDLEPITYDKISSDNFLVTAADFEVALTAIYANAGAQRRNRILFGMRGTDEFRSNNGGEDKLNNFQWENTGPFESLYTNNIPSITRAGSFLLDIQNTDVLSDDLRNSYMAQVRTARAFLMYELLTNYGACPVITDSELLATISTNFNYMPSRPEPGTTEYETYYRNYVEFIENDLNTAISQFENSENVRNIGQKGRFNKAVALTVLSKLYLHEKEWSKAETVCRAIIDLAESGENILYNYSLFEDYNNMWSLKAEGNSEIIFAIPQTAGSYGQDFRAWTLHPHYTADETSYNGDKVRIPFYDSFDPADIRRKNITMEFTNIYSSKTVDMRKSPHNGGFIFKYQQDPDAAQMSGVDVIVYRLADIYLSLAEAICWKEGGTTSDANALKYFNLVRDRAKLPRLNSLTTDIILQERAWELYFEGYRREDLIRHEQYISKARDERGVDAKDFQILYPIPLGAITENPAIKQNSGYNF